MASEVAGLALTRGPLSARVSSRRRLISVWLRQLVRPGVSFGFLVLSRLFTRLALAARALLILALTFGTTLRQDWQTAGLQLIYAAIYAALLAGVAANRYSADALFRRDAQR